jgi:hypothetical protein
MAKILRLLPEFRPRILALSWCSCTEAAVPPTPAEAWGNLAGSAASTLTGMLGETQREERLREYAWKAVTGGGV